MKQILRKWRLATLVVAIFAMLSIPGAFAEKDQGVAWDANTEPDLAGYRIYFTLDPGVYEFGGQASQNFLAEIPCPPNDDTCCIYNKPNLTGPGYFFVATAYDTDGFESLPSNEINSLPPGQVKNFRW